MQSMSIGTLGSKSKIFLFVCLMQQLKHSNAQFPTVQFLQATRHQQKQPVTPLCALPPVLDHTGNASKSKAIYTWSFALISTILDFHCEAPGKISAAWVLTRQLPIHRTFNSPYNLPCQSSLARLARAGSSEARKGSP